MRGARGGREDGQAMAEFALVLPMLALMTFGTIEVTLWLQQQSTLNAAAFMAARSASVVGGELGATRTALQPFVDTSPPWMGGAVQGMKARASGSRGSEVAAFELEARGDRFSGLIAALTEGSAHPTKGFDTLASGAALPMEYVPKRHGNRKTGQKPRSMYSYRVVDTEQALKPKPITKVQDAAAKIKQAYDDLAAVIRRIPPPAAPAPSSAPKPGGGTGGGKGGGTGGGKGGGTGGGTGATPANPGLSLDAWKKLQEIPAIRAVDTKGPIFDSRGAVVQNPQAETGGGRFSSLKYVSPQFEEEAPRNRLLEFSAATQAAALEKAEQDVGKKDAASLKATCDQMRVYIDLAMKSQFPGAAPAAAKFKKAAGDALERLEEGFEADYNKAVRRERNLFKGTR